nr:aspartate carbamoyltransferase [uncultured Campylobacter sp.]
MEILPQITQILAETPSIAIDTIRASFLKNRITRKHYTKIELLKSIAKTHGLKWRKMQDTKEIKISNRYEFRGLKITELYELENLSIFYAATKAPNECRQRAVIEFYGLKQYHKPAPPFDLVAELLGAVNNVSSVDLCFDRPEPFNLDAFDKAQIGDTTYLKMGLTALERVYFYDKAKKNNLNLPLYRAEATAPIVDLNKPALLPRAERLELQLCQAVRDFSQIIEFATAPELPKLTAPTYKAKNNKRELRA